MPGLPLAGDGAGEGAGGRAAPGARLMVFDDITEIVSAQRSAAWAEVARRLAHEIKNPLTPIQLSAERLRHKLEAKLEGTDQALLLRSVNTIVSQVQAMQTLVNEFRDYARLPAAQMEPLDLNALARGKEFFALEVFEVSDDGRLLAYSTDEVGDENYTLVIKDLTTGAALPDRLARVTSAAWSASGREILYTVRDDMFRSYALYRHRLGDVGADALVWQEDDAKYELSVQRSRSGEWLFAAADSYGASEVRVARADRTDAPWRTIAARRPGHLYDIDHAGDTFYVRSNDDTPTFRVMAAPEDDPGPARWRPVVAGRADVAIAEVDAFAGHLVVLQREQGLPGLEIVALATGARTKVAATELRGLVGIAVDENPELAASAVRVSVTSVHSPDRTVDVTLADGRATQVSQRPAVGPCGGTTATLGTARAPDGTEIKYLHFAGRGGEGARPLLLEAYGAYGSVYDPDFVASRCAVMNRGVDFVIAWVRGGGELGEPWHDAARVRLRERSAGDLIAVAERLIADGRTTARQLVIAGVSAGGGLMGAVLNARPELLAGAVLEVPFLDAVGTMADASAPLTTIEYEEWGDPRVREDYEVLRRWCPYTNVRAIDYPPVLAGHLLWRRDAPRRLRAAGRWR